MTDITLYNTRTRRKEALVPHDPANVRMYVCGPTVYDRAHIGNARPVVVFDVLFRLLRHVYGADHVTYVRNLTDVDDKINARAAATRAEGETELQAIRRITDETIGWYHADMGALGALPPTHEPRATEYIAPMVEMIGTLVARGNAYVAEGHVLFEVATDPEYGTLARRDLEEMRAGARVEVAPWKRDPMDFVLWKPSDATQPGWDSPWGRGRPGWHIECSAMAHELLGTSFDIHGGGIDLAFPHHENECAQSRCAHPEGSFANIWMHNGFVNVEGEKMSKSLGNFFTVRDLIDTYEKQFAIPNIGPAIRLRLLEGHYRSPLDAGCSFIEAASTKLGQWWFWTSQHLYEEIDTNADFSWDSPVVAALADDLNSPRAIAAIDSMVAALRRLPANNTYIDDDSDAKEKIANEVVASLRLLGFEFAELEIFSTWSKELKLRRATEGSSSAKLVEALLEARDDARANKNWKRADQIREGFASAGVLVKDTPNGTTWELRSDFDPAKLEALK